VGGEGEKHLLSSVALDRDTTQVKEEAISRKVAAIRDFRDALGTLVAQSSSPPRIRWYWLQPWARRGSLVAANTHRQALPVLPQATCPRTVWRSDASYFIVQRIPVVI